VQRAIGSLPVSYREAIVLCDVQELPYEQAAVVIGCPIGTVRSRLHRGRALLADKLRARVGLRGIA
jgi:RNA polymerase sigma-70 factor (ECF subfamily)